jgi:Uma2 family endonuclease
MDTITVVGTSQHWTPTISLDVGKHPRKMSEDQFFVFCQNNREMRIERDKLGDIEIMAPAGMRSGNQNFNLNGEFFIWAKKNGKGVGFDSSAGFTLPNGAVRSPDLAWMTKEKFDSIAKDDREKFAHVCPDFVVELRSKTDALKKLQAKMEEYIENGASLGWLIDAITHKVYVYRQDTEVEILKDPKEISGGELLKGFKLKLKEIWE